MRASARPGRRLEYSLSNVPSSSVYKPATFSSRTAAGCAAASTRQTSRYSWPRPSSAKPSCGPANEKHWHGKPPTRMSWAGMCSSATSVMSPASGGRPKLASYVAAACGSISDANTQAPPRDSNPRRKPPMPAKSSANRNPPGRGGGTGHGGGQRNRRTPGSQRMALAASRSAMAMGTQRPHPRRVAPSMLRCTSKTPQPSADGRTPARRRHCVPPLPSASSAASTAFMWPLGTCRQPTGTPTDGCGRVVVAIFVGLSRFLRVWVRSLDLTWVRSRREYPRGYSLGPE